MNVTFLRRRALGAGSIRGIVGHMTNMFPESVKVVQGFYDGVNVIRNDKIHVNEELLGETDWLVRWGCTTETGVPLAKQINESSTIKRVSDKRGFRKLVSEKQVMLSPRTIFQVGHPINYARGVVVRPKTHAQGKNIWLVYSELQLLALTNNEPALQNGWYASEFIDKVSEYRVYVISGKIVTIANKIPDDPKAVAWNVAQGGKFEVLRWDDWGQAVCDVAIEAFNMSGLDFAGVDIMVDKNGFAYLIEVNSAPSLPIMVEGKASYRQKCMAMGLQYIFDNGKDKLEIDYTIKGWRRYIHPSIWNKGNKNV